MQFFTSFILSALLMATASAQRGLLAARNCTDDAAALPPLDIWAETHLSAVVHSKNPDEVAAAFDAFWSDDVWITFNGVATSAADYHARRITQGFIVTLDIMYAATVAAPTVANSSQAGAVALYFTNQIGNVTVTSIMNLLIAPDPYLTGNDTRRVYNINQIAAGL
ncbi:hypothetical protein B0H16DRAFT_1888174 [Mycena metata]|uniref:SnoaL-like domain-containing protein n=1 Tax=Mycena metata TaxID=1033252 RepID=A0AAD7N7N4_9AGAR|nr:hypothetical protein B0H16DRAFT_1888174 [Mycena metata]